MRGASARARHPLVSPGVETASQLVHAVLDGNLDEQSYQLSMTTKQPAAWAGRPWSGRRTGTCAFAAAESFGGAPVDRQVGQVQADRLVVGVQAAQPQPVPHAESDPLVPAAVQRRRRTTAAGDALVAGAEH